jgi:hypothetical protein
MKRAILAMCTVSLLSSCGPTEPQQPTILIPIGAALDRTGTAATPSWLESVKLAVKHANAGLKASKNEKLGSIQFELIVADTENNTALAPTRVRELVDDGVKAVVIQQAPISIAVNALNYDPDPAKHLDVPLLCPNCVLPALNNPNATNSDPLLQMGSRDEANWFFRSVMSNAKDAEIVLRLVSSQVANGDLNGDGKFKVGVYASSDVGLNSFRTNVANAAKAINPAVIVEDTVQFPFNISVDSHDFDTDMARLLDDKVCLKPTGGYAAGWGCDPDTSKADAFPDVLVELTPSGIGAAATGAYLDTGSTVKFLHMVNFRNANTIEVLKDRANGQEGTSPVVFENNANGTLFSEAMLAETGFGPAIQDSNFYDGTMLTLLATLSAVSELHPDDPAAVTGAEVRQMLARDTSAGTVFGTGTEQFRGAVDAIAAGGVVNYDGASGPVDLDARGDVRNRIVQWRVENRVFVDQQIYDCVASTDCPVVTQ